MRPGGSLPRGGGVTWSLQLLIVVITVINEVQNVPPAPTTNPDSRTGIKNITIPLAVADSRKFACKVPQRRAYHVHDLVHNTNLLDSSEIAEQPIYIILKRCDSHSGCCMNPKMTCTPVSDVTYYENVEIEISSVNANQSRRQWFTVEQHGSCSCELTNSEEREKLEIQKPTFIAI